MHTRLALSRSLISLFVFCLAPPLFAEQIEIRFTGTITWVYTPGADCFNGAIGENDPIEGSYVYETEFDICEAEQAWGCWGDYEVFQWSPYWNPDQYEYYYSAPPMGLRIVHPSGITFQTSYEQDYNAFYIALTDSPAVHRYFVNSDDPLVSGGGIDPFQGGFMGIRLFASPLEDPEWRADELPTEAPDLTVWDSPEGLVKLLCPEEIEIWFDIETMEKEGDTTLPQDIEEAIQGLDIPADSEQALLERLLTALAKLDGEVSSILKTYQACNELQALLDQLEALKKGNRTPPEGVEELIDMVVDYMGPDYVDCDNAPVPPFG